jgi:hypothetical protein
MERAGIPTAQVTAMTSISLMIGVPRVVQGVKIVNPMGNEDMEAWLLFSAMSSLWQMMPPGTRCPAHTDRGSDILETATRLARK